MTVAPEAAVDFNSDNLVTEADALRKNAAERPDHAALVFQHQVTTYGELNLRSNQVANGLLELGIARGSRVAILTKNSAEFFELFFGILKAGMTVLPVNWRLTIPELSGIFKDAGVEILFVHFSFEEMVPGLKADIPNLRDVFTLGRATSDADFAIWRDRQPISDPALPALTEEIMIQFYTSGTTGKPKGVQISHHSSRIMRVMEVEADEPWMQWGPEDVSIVALPNFHLSGTSWALQWLARGSLCVVQEQVDPTAFLEAIQEYKVTHLMAVPTVIGMMLENPKLNELDVSSLKVIFYGGAPMSPPLLRQAIAKFHCDFVQIYGMTENNGTVCYLSPSDHLLGETLLKSCGRPLPAISMRIMNPEMQELPRGEVGEICIASPSLMSGYWKREDLKAEVMYGDYYRTGDAGYRDAEGYLFVVDRLKDMIVSGGENIYPAEIEHALLEHPKIAEVAIIGVPDVKWGEAVRAVIVPADDTLSEQDVGDWLKGKIASYKTPKKITFVTALPRNANGKVLKRVLRDTYSLPPA